MSAAPPIAVRGTGVAVCDSGFLAVDDLIADAVDNALEAASIGLDGIGCVVAMGNDADDGMLSPLLRAEAAGAVGREYLFVTGVFGQAVAAAVPLLAGGLTSSAIVVGWCPASPAVTENEVMIADPFFTRPVGATPDALRRLLDAALGRPSHPAAGPLLDAAACLVLSRHEPATSADVVTITDWRSTFRPFLPDVGDMDPLFWVRQAVGEEAAAASDHLFLSSRTVPAGAVDSRLTVLDGRPEVASWIGGALDLFHSIGQLESSDRLRDVWFAESAGPLGQSVTALNLKRAA